MRKRIKKIINKKANKKANKKVYDMKLKELLLKSNKEDVINYAITLISQKSAFTLGYKEKEFNKSKLKDKKYLSQKYDYYLNFSKKDYSNDLAKDNILTKESSYPFTFGEFLNISNTLDKSNTTSMFFKSYNKDNYPMELFLDCYISSDLLCDFEDFEIVAKFLLQSVYTEEENKKYIKILKKRKANK